MSSLLRSLAAQALGQAPGLRPAARLRRDADLVATEREAARDSAADDAMFDQESAGPTNRAAPVAAKLAGDLASGFDVQPVPVAASAESTEGSPVVTQMQPAQLQGPAQRHKIDLANLDAVAGRDTPRPASHSETIGRGSRAAADVELRAASTASFAGRIISAAEKPEVRVPQAIHAAPARRGGIEARSVAQREQSSASAPPDVHIHIGRIELTAVSAPALRRERPVAASKSNALNEYLQRRGRKPA